MGMCDSFVFFRDWDRSMWEKSLKELKEHGIGYVMMSGPCRLSEILKDEELAREAKDFMEFAYDKFRIRSIIFVGSRVSDELFVDQDFAEAQADMIARGMKRLKRVKGLYALYIEDEPYLGWDVRPSSVRDKYNDLFEEETGHRLPEKGRVMGRWDFETAMAYCHWISQKYLGYIKNIIQKYKEVSPNVKSAINLHIGGIFPSADNPVDVQGIIELVDILITDIYPGWNFLPRDMESMTDFRTRLLRCLTDKPLWNILQGHLVIPGYAPTLQQIERWAMKTVENGWDAVGWYANDHNFAPNLRVNISSGHTKYACKERWNKMMEVSKRTSGVEKKKPEKTDTAIFTSFDSILGYDRIPILYTYVTLHTDGGMNTEFVTERMIEKKPEILDNYSYLYLGPSPILRKSIAPALEAFVRNGGTLVGSGNDAVYGEKGQNLSKWRKRLFGIGKEELLWDEDSIRLKRAIGDLEEGCLLRCFWERRAIVKTEGRVNILGVWKNGHPAIVSKEIGKGKSIYIGTRPYRANCQAQGKRWTSFMRGVKKTF